MSYRDRLLVCEECGEEFVFPIEAQRRQEELGFDIEVPTLCPDCKAEEPATAEPGLKAGVVKWYRDDRGFGFIIQREGDDIFFHRTGVVQGDAAQVLKENAPVWYEVEMTSRGPQAINVHARE